MNAKEAKTEIGYPIDYVHGGGRTGFVPELDVAAGGLLKLEKMAKTDETIGAMLFVIGSTLTQLEWSHTPCVGGREVARDDPEYDKAREFAEFADSCLEDMEHSFVEHVEEALTMIWAGFAPCEIVLKKRDGVDSRFDDGRWGFKELPLRDQHSITDWVPDERGKPIRMVQQTTQGGRVEIPLYKVLHYRTSRVLNDPWGFSLLHACYRPWFLKQRIQESEAVGIDRELCGMPMFKIPSEELVTAARIDADGAPTAEANAARSRIDAAIKAATRMRYNQNAGLVLPSDVYEDGNGELTNVAKWSFEIVASSGQRSIDARTAARDYDRGMARTLLFQFLHLGDRAGGSNALSEDQSSLALRSLKAIALKISGEFNRKALPLLWLVNALPKKYLPKLEPGPITEETAEQLGLFLQRLGDAEPIIADDPALQDALFAKVGLRASRNKIRDVEPRAPRQPKSGEPAEPPAKGERAIKPRAVKPGDAD